MPTDDGGTEALMATINIGTSREVMWDMHLADKTDNVHLTMQKPVRKNIILNCDAPWEGEHCGYGSVVYDGEKYRLYYRGAGANGGPWQTENGTHWVWCVAYSDDGKTFRKPNLGIYEYEGSKDNNIIHMENRELDNFSVQIDTNPNCPPGEKYKAFSGGEYDRADDGSYILRTYDSPPNPDKAYRLAYYKSADGLNFEYVTSLDVYGAFDSLNFVMWDEEIQKYRMYFRGYHEIDKEKEIKIEYEAENHVRDIRVAFSEDFVNWSEPQLLDYKDDPTAFQLYTNCIEKYKRGNIFYGIPTRYIDRSPDTKNYEYLPDVGGFRPMLREKYGRGGTAITEATLMTSRDGISFERTHEAFLSPGIENGDNWVYGDSYFVRGMIETASDFKGEPNELSLYVGTGYRARPVTFERFTIRLDGLFSWKSDFKGGTVMTKPLTFDGNKMNINFETSALGYIQIDICDENEKEIDGYSSGRIFGNSVNRPCDFDKPLCALKGRTVRMKISMKDAQLYSFAVEE